MTLDQPADKQDTKQDSQKKLPESEAVRRFVLALQKEAVNGGLPRGRKGEIAKEIAAETGIRPESLIRQAYRYKHLWKEDK